jgi:uncharacterized membrane-anchored protein YjiN (DUF445 family)
MSEGDKEQEEGRLPAPVTVPEARAYTKARGRELRVLLMRYVRRHMPPPPPRKEPRDMQPPRMVGAHARLLPFLQVIPILLAILFLTSFFWDFPGIEVSAFGLSLPLAGLLRITSVSGLIGFATNWLAITMLFQPREERPIFGQGLIPAQRERVIYRLARAVSEELINEEIIKRKIEESGVIPRVRETSMQVARGVIEDPDFRRELKQIVSEYFQQVLSSEVVRERIIALTVGKIEEYAGRGWGGLALKAYRYVNEADFQRRVDEAVTALPRSIDAILNELDHLLDRVPEKLEAQSHQIEAWATRAVMKFVENLDVYGMIIENMSRYDESKLESLLKKTSNEQLNYIKYLGGVLGFIGGLVIWMPLLALGTFAVIGTSLYTIDEVLFRRRKAG